MTDLLVKIRNKIILLQRPTTNTDQSSDYVPAQM
jgi:hypothetical protein